MSTLQEAREICQPHLSTVRTPKKAVDPNDAAIEKMMRDTAKIHDLSPGKVGNKIFKTFYCRRIARLKATT